MGADKEEESVKEKAKKEDASESKLNAGITVSIQEDVEESALTLLNVNGLKTKKPEKPIENVEDSENVLEEEQAHVEESVKDTEFVEEKTKKEDVESLQDVTLNVSDVSAVTEEFVDGERTNKAKNKENAG